MKKSIMVCATATAVLAYGVGRLGFGAPSTEQTIEDRLSARWVQTYDSGNADAIGALYAHDARVTHGYCQVISGREAITEFWRTDLHDGVFTTRLESKDSFVTDDLVYINGTYSVLDKAAAESSGGSYTQIWRRIDADWLLFREAWVNLACVDIEVRSRPPGLGDTQVLALPRNTEI
jgi:ketosteroid isomerase-like protein